MVGIRWRTSAQEGIHVTLADMASHIFAPAAYPQVSEIIEDHVSGSPWAWTLPLDEAIILKTPGRTGKCLQELYGPIWGTAAVLRRKCSY